MHLLALPCQPWSPIMVMVSLPTALEALIGGTTRVAVVIGPHAVVAGPLMVLGSNVRYLSR
jgi:hypothetical protein